MAKTASEIVDRSLTLIDEVVTDFLTAATTETSIREIALEILSEVCRDLIKELPWELKRYLAESAELTADTLGAGEDQSDFYKQKVVFAAPDDFWELVSLRMTVWSRPATEYILVNSPEYSAQSNPFTRAGKRNPVVAISNIGSGSDARIECFSVNSGDDSTVEVFEYVSFDNVPDDDTITWPDELFEAVTMALKVKLEIIKSDLEQAEITGKEITNTLEQHE